MYNYFMIRKHFSIKLVKTNFHALHGFFDYFTHLLPILQKFLEPNRSSILKIYFDIRDV